MLTVGTWNMWNGATEILPRFLLDLELGWGGWLSAASFSRLPGLECGNSEVIVKEEVG
jgi:hypothetical protein